MASEDNTVRCTEDFDAMLNISIWNSLGFFFMGFFIPIIARFNMSASGIEIGLLVSSQVIGRMLSSFLIGIITDRTESRKILILIGSFGRAISYFMIFASIITNDLISLWYGNFVLGFCAGIFWVPFDTLIAEKSNKNHRSYAYGKKNSNNTKGQIIGALIGFSIFVFMSYLTNESVLLYLIIPFYGIANIYAGIRFFRNVDDSIKFSSDLSVEQVPNLKRQDNRPFLIGVIFLMCVTLMASINGTLAKPFLNIYLLENIESDFFFASMAYLPGGIVAAFLAPKLGTLIDKARPLIGITITSILGAIITWFLVNTSNLWVFAILLLFDITINTAAGLIFQNLMSRITFEHRGKIMGVSSFFASFGNVIGPILGGFVWDLTGPKSPFIISIFVELLLIPLYLGVVYLLIPNLAESYDKNKGS